MSKKTNWDKLKNQDALDSMQYRDVYEDQQLERSKIQEKDTITSRRILAIVFTVIVTAIAYFLFTLGQFVVDTGKNLSKGGISFSKIQPQSISLYLPPSLWKIGFGLVCGLMFYAIMDQIMRRNLEAQNLMNDTTDINQYQNDQHIALPEEIQRKFDYFPDAGAHSHVQVSSMISHMMIANKGIKKVKLYRRADKDILNEDGDVEYYEGDVLLDSDGNPIIDTLPMFDGKFGEDLFTVSEVPKDKRVRKYYDATGIEYNIGNKKRGKVKDCNTVADLINKDWVLPDYEPQRPAGVYVVDTEPVNTMV